jgi:hypothetical protein
MKTCLIAVLLLPIAFPAFAGADPFSEFQIPAHSWASGSVGASMTGNWSAAGDNSSESRRNAFQSQLNPSLLLARDSELLQHSLFVELAGATNVLDEDQIFRSYAYTPNVSQYRNTNTQSTTESWQVDGSLRLYPWTTPLGLGVSGSATGAYEQGWSCMEQSLGPGFVGNDRQDVHRYAYNARLAVSAGIGRIRDATVIQDVHVLEQRLRETGAISRSLSNTAREKLAALYYVTPFFSAAHERPDRYVWREVERLLRADGVLSGHGLDPYSVLRAKEPYLYRVTRLRGWFLGPIVEGQHQHSVERFEDYAWISRYNELDDLVPYWSSFEARRFVTSRDGMNAGALAQFGRPVGWRWQFDLRSQVMTPVRPGERGLVASSGATATWLVADRWEAQAFCSHARQWLAPRGGLPLRDDSWDVRAGAELGWYLEDRVRVSASIVQAQSRDYYYREPRPGGPQYINRTYLRDTRFFLGITYRFLGRLDAPGLMGPARFMH